jgi:hypothetical protein
MDFDRVGPHPQFRSLAKELTRVLSNGSDLSDLKDLISANPDIDFTLPFTLEFTWWSPPLANRELVFPLHVACVMANLPAVRFLICDGADVNFRADDGRTAFMIACSVPGNYKMIRLFLKTPRVQTEQTSIRGATALFHAVECGDLGNLSELLNSDRDLNRMAVCHVGSLLLGYKLKSRTAWDLAKEKPKNAQVLALVRAYYTRDWLGLVSATQAIQF